MAVVFDPTVGSATANSYCDVATADDYHATRGFNDEWSAATTGDKEKVLMWATRLLDQHELRGSKTFPSGALRFPRVGLLNREGELLPSNEIPTVVKEAVAEWAFYLLGEDRTADEGGLAQYHGKVGPLNDPHYYVRKPMPDSVRDMLATILTGSRGNMARLGRV